MNLESVLQTAIGIEQEGIEFYSKSIAKVEDENGKDILRFLAGEEKRHKAFFESLLKKHGKGEKKDVQLLMVPRIFPESHEPEEGEATEADRHVLEHAKETENRSIDLYESILRSVSDKEIRAGIKIVLNEERQHLAWVEYLLGNINTHEYWGGLQEHFSLDG